MGNTFTFTVAADTPSKAAAYFQLAVAEVKRIEALLTTFSDDSYTNRINAAAGMHPVQVPPEVFQLITRAQKISRLTQGAFDLSYGGLDKRFWNFDRQMATLPTPSQALESIRLIDYRKILLDERDSTVFLSEKGMRIGFGGIGKGYAADRVRLLLQAQGVRSGIVNASGDLCAWGNQPDGRCWTVGLADPDHRQRHIALMPLREMAVATSGDYEKFAMIAGKRYAHTIDPRTGYPVHGIRSVTVMAPTAELADAFTTPVMVLGVRLGLQLIDQIRGMGCLIVDEQGHSHYSANIHLHL